MAVELLIESEFLAGIDVVIVIRTKAIEFIFRVRKELLTINVL